MFRVVKIHQYMYISGRKYSVLNLTVFTLNLENDKLPAVHMRTLKHRKFKSLAQCYIVKVDLEPASWTYIFGL